MKAQLVLVEREDRSQNTVLGCSGLMLNDRYVIITANIIFDQWAQTILEELQPGEFSANLSKYGISLNVVAKEEDMYSVKKARLLSAFVSGNIKNSNKVLFRHWAIDSIDNNRGVNEAMSLFFVLTVSENTHVEDFKGILNEWWNLVISLDFNKGDEIYITTVPFANRDFMNSVSKGIVSNTFGNSSCFVLSDCPCTPGAEGSPVYLYNNQYLSKSGVPLGLVLSSVSWWKGEWVGLTLIADIKSVIAELVDIPLRLFNTIRNIKNPKLIASVECCVVQIYNRKRWGTGVLLSREKGIFLTNSHVVENARLSIFHKGKTHDARLVYQTPENDVFDLAVVKCDPAIIKNKFELKSIPISRKKYKLGDDVYAAGYSLFPKECNPSPSISGGCISQVNPFMIKTTCCVQPGSSGGAVLDGEGALLGIIVCNAKLEDNNVVYPRINMAVPFSAISEAIFSFIKTDDPTVLSNLHVKNKEAEFVWKRIEGKL